VLAESITPHQGSLSEWVIRLRPGVTWHNGKDFTASDVLFSFQRVFSNGFTGKFGLGPIDLAKTKALDPHTVLVQLTKPFSSFAEQLAAFWYNLYIAPEGSTRPSRSAPGPSYTRASRPASAASSPATRTTGSPGCPTWTRSPSSTSATTPPCRTR
jgi:ABC-type dipeptide transport system, periplasmic component